MLGCTTVPPTTAADVWTVALAKELGVRWRRCFGGIRHPEPAGIEAVQIVEGASDGSASLSNFWAKCPDVRGTVC
ncbi:hypothetical protein WMF28_10040 [Sorangium sp. So ce590]|uniref:hypothetical protein n=1 Tax=Sorangium sp. So ce590 TaxID=3133317 RepID=UPI003F63D7B7